jgi:ectoine hydroxylase-related dioxygenase (phytanoyl-CoA dioxygenase family)
MNKVNTYTPPLFRTDNFSKWKKHLDEEGYVVLEKVLPDDHKVRAFSYFVEDWQTVSPKFDFHDKTTWSARNSPMMWNKGMVYWNGLGQSNFQWYLRTHPFIRDIYEKLYETHELVVSFDGLSVFLSSTQKPGLWLHTDKNPKKTEYSIQGAYNVLPVQEDDAGFVVVPKSHKTYVPDVEEWKQFIQLDDDDKHYERAVKLLIPANCFIVWNSLTIHANIGMNKKATTELNRLTAYITYFPKEMRSQDVYGKRLLGYKEAENCGHWATRHDKKRHPWGLKDIYEGRGFQWIKPKLDEDGNIPSERLRLI